MLCLPHCKLFSSEHASGVLLLQLVQSEEQRIRLHELLLQLSERVTAQKQIEAIQGQVELTQQSAQGEEVRTQGTAFRLAGFICPRRRQPLYTL